MMSLGNEEPRCRTFMLNPGVDANSSLSVCVFDDSAILDVRMDRAVLVDTELLTLFDPALTCWPCGANDLDSSPDLPPTTLFFCSSWSVI